MFKQIDDLVEYPLYNTVENSSNCKGVITMNEEKIKYCKSVKKYNPALDNMSAVILSAMTIAVRKAVKENRQLRRKQTAGRIPAADKGLTLIELLIVISIMVMLVAVSVPMFKPMFESQRTKVAAQTVAAALQRVRFKAMEENTAYGIQFVPWDGPQANNTVSLQMKLVRRAAGNAKVNGLEYRARVEEGEIKFYQYNSGTYNSVSPTAVDPPYDSSKGITQIKFGRQGRIYNFNENSSSGKLYLQSPYNSIDLPPKDGASDYMEFSWVESVPKPVLTSPVSMPRGTVVDLRFSGVPNQGMNTKMKLNKIDTIENIFSDNSNTYIYFLPNGTASGLTDQNRFYGGLIYICIGEWDRQVMLKDLGNPKNTNNLPDKTNTDKLDGTDNNKLDNFNCQAEDGKNNILTLTNYWVTLNPLTGQVRIMPMATAVNAADTNGARKFAAEHWGISE